MPIKVKKNHGQIKKIHSLSSSFKNMALKNGLLSLKTSQVHILSIQVESVNNADKDGIIILTPISRSRTGLIRNNGSFICPILSWAISGLKLPNTCKVEPIIPLKIIGIPQ
jgi:hypothetical protein